MSVTFPNRTIPTSLVLFLSLFAAQSAVIALSPVLASVAGDLGVSTATAGQLRSVSGLVAGLVAVGMGALSGRFGLRDLLILGLSLLGVGSLLSAAAPTFAVLAAAQVVVGAGLGVVISSGLAAAAEWSAPERRSRVLSWTLIGQPAAWIVGMPAIGAIGDLSWRAGWIAVPFVASALALLAVGSRSSDAIAEPARESWLLLWRDRNLGGWALSELLAFSAWAGALVYTGALFVESYGVSPAIAGLLLAGAAIAYLPGNFLARRWVEGYSRQLLVALPLAAATIVTLLGAYRPALGVSAAIFVALGFVGGARTIAGSALGLEVCATRRVFGMRVRAAATQFGYLFGAAFGGIALASGGYAGLGAMFGVLFALAAIPHILAMLSQARPAGSPEAAIKES